jgi:SpoVK/Ycf46/Vps4 family AAA+-type ATPase
MLVRALAMTANARFLCVSPSTLLRKYVGETNINVKALFSLARKLSPCIIFIDEVEGLFRERRTSGDEEHEVNRELKTEFMQLWDGIHKTNEGVIIVGATNRPFDVDSALLRRMPRSFYVGLPDDKARRSIIKGILQNVPTSPHFSIDQVVTALSGYSPSDIKEVMRTAALFPLREARSQLFKSDKRSPYKLPILRALETSDVLQACMKISPTQLSPEYASSLRSFTSNANRIGQSDPFQRDEDFFISNSVEDEEECLDSDLYDSSMNESYDDDNSL